MQNRLEIVDIDLLYTLVMMNTNCFIKRHFALIDTAVKLIVHYLPGLIGRFVDDLYKILHTDSNIMDFEYLLRNILAIASDLVARKPYEFWQAIQTNLSEEAFKTALFRTYMTSISAQVQEACLSIYASAGDLTLQLTEMIFTTFAIGYLPRMCIKYTIDAIRRIEGRIVIETLFLHLKSPSMYRRYLAVRLLVRLLLVDCINEDFEGIYSFRHDDSFEAADSI